MPSAKPYQTQTTVDVGRHQQSIKSPGTSTINHQLSPSDTSVPRIFGEVSSKRRPKKKSGPQTARLCDEIGRTFPGFLLNDLHIEKHTKKKHSRKNTTTREQQPEWLLLYFIRIFVSI